MEQNCYRVSLESASKYEIQSCLVSRQVATAKKATVHLSPPWTTIFQGEKVILTCDGFNSSKPRTQWYKDEQWQKKWSTESIVIQQAGAYRCQNQDSDLSDPVHLVVSSDQLILQTPYSVFEGDTLTLKCRGRHNERIRNITYYKDGMILSYFLKNSVFVIPQVGLSHSAQYHCTGIAGHLKIFYQKISSRKVELQIQELFSPPELKATTSQPTEGTPVTLSCDTQLSPRRSDTKLHFAFFRDGRAITADWMRSQVLQIPAIWREDSGSYSCEAKAVTQDIRKQSKHVKISVKRIPISGIFMKIQPSGGQVTEGEKVVLICSVTQGTGNITFSWHREGINASLGEKTRHSLEEKFVLSAVNKSDAGKYYCTADNNISTISSQMADVIVRREGYRYRNGKWDELLEKGLAGGRALRKSPKTHRKYFSYFCGTPALSKRQQQRAA
ncbi:Fc receptor-like protein 4 [Gracilinanus agilis]|uniref:Fc receptor-like protein 4 n=1 Tax=Gracilinanus agilis TaxID=191870 RepID=UPI001CFE1404|nr:Fc receptor-like protein 4 [Gracilinanus agilis]